MSAPTALYRRYRPDSFADVIGQEHVTAPLMAALDKNRVNHAYLFSGPRGCGKTTSARILARCLNCAQGPTSHPCGTCDSCVELARGGPGSLDVIEIDAASHGGVDDARDLRERATFAPIRDRYKIFIIDEAHMVTSAGFNALLKIVEEPPEHIKFIFATTEPDKVIGTIRSRTHHYPFRLVPPEPLMAYLAHLCEQENVPVAPGVLSLVIRAGGGSVRDSLSVLDQLMAGAGAAGLDYELAVDLLGYTHASLLDDVVEALAAADSATVFKSVDRVIQTGHDPRRFVEDLLERFRDLIIVQAMPESAHAILRGTPDELIARMQTQAAQLGAAELSRAADVTNSAFNEMTGATSPRLHLELLGARLLLPGADASARGMAARLDAMERRLNYGAAPAATPVPGAPAPLSVAPAQSIPGPAATFPSAGAPAAQGGGLAAVRAQLAKAKEAAGAKVASRHKPDAAQIPAADAVPEVAPAAAPAAGPEWGTPSSPKPATSTPAGSTPAEVAVPTWDDLPTTAPTWDDIPAVPPVTSDTAEQPTPAQAALPEQVQQEPAVQREQPAQPPAPAPAAAPAAAAQAQPSQAGTGSSGIEVIRRAWPEILGTLSNIRKASWALVNLNVVPRAFDGQVLRVALPTTALIQTFENGGHADNLRQAIHTTLGITCQLDPITGDAPSTGTSAEPNPKGLADRRPLNPERGNPTPAPATGRGHGGPQETPVAASTQALAPAASVADPVPAPAAAPAPAREVAAAPQAAASPEPVPEAPAARNAASPDTAAPSPAPRVSPASEWSGPIPEEPSWDEEPPHDDWAPEPTQYATAPPAAVQPPEPVQEAAPYRPKVSPISAWTTGWDMPAEPVAPTPTVPEATATPRRSQLLAQQAQQSSNDTETGHDAPQDWGVSLGAASRTRVADPGWGAASAAPDWSQPAAPPSAGPAETRNADAPSTASQPEATAPVPGTPDAPERTVQPPVQAETGPSAPAAAAGSAANAKMSMYQRLSNSPEAQAGRVQAPARAADTPYVEDVPSPDDVTIEESGVVGQAAVERILGGALIEERPLNGSN